MHNKYNRIRELRDKNGKSQKITAELLGYQTTTYQRWEQEIHNIKLKDALKIAEYYGVSLDYIAGRTDNPKGGIK